MKYGLWLQPTGKSYEDLQNLINELARKFDCPVFEPHVTLLGGIDVNLEELISKTEKLAKLSSSFKIKLENTSFSSTYFQNVFYLVEPNKDLLDLRIKLHGFFPNKVDEAYFPHFSLTYGDYSAEQRQEILEYVENKNLRFGFEISSINISQAETKDTKTWSVTQKFSLKRQFV